jgi:hypothetical protein
MKRASPDAGRRRARRRERGAAADVAPLYATGVFAVATLALVTFAAPASLRAMAPTTSVDACPPRAEAQRTYEYARG